MEDKHVSVSQLKTFSLCGWQYNLVYQEGFRIAPGFALHVGAATHDSMGADLIYKIEHGTLLELDAVQTKARDSVNRRWDEEGVWLTEEEEEKGILRVKGEVVDTAVSLATLHHNKLAPIIDPAPMPRGVEWEWRLSLPGYDHDLTGRTDIIEKIEQFRELKTRSSKPPENLEHKDIQISAYAMAIKNICGFNPKIAMDFLVKTKTPTHYTRYTERTREDFQVVLRRFEAFLDAKEKQVFVPCPDDSWKCAPKWCGFYKDKCKFVNYKRRPVN